MYIHVYALTILFLGCTFEKRFKSIDVCPGCPLNFVNLEIVDFDVADINSSIW